MQSVRKGWAQSSGIPLFVWCDGCQTVGVLYFSGMYVPACVFAGRIFAPELMNFQCVSVSRRRWGATGRAVSTVTPQVLTQRRGTGGNMS